MNYSIIIPVYKNQDSISDLLNTLEQLRKNISKELEVIFVVDGSPDKSFLILQDALPNLRYKAQILIHSRNFGSFAAIRTGLAAATGSYFAIMAADLQEPNELILNFFNLLSKADCDIVIGTRTNRNDPVLSKITSNIFWFLYKKFIIREIPVGGVDVVACNILFKDSLLELEESRSSLIGLIFWLGFRRKEVLYTRQKRRYGKSAWTLNKKIEYMMDSFFSFTDFPIRLLINIGFIGSFLLLFLSFFVFFCKIFGLITISGYTTIILVVSLIGSFNLFGLGLVGSYAWRTYENSKKRPLAIVAHRICN